MNPDSRTGRDRLREIARRAMRERGFEPDFPPAVLAETSALTQPAARPDGPVEDLRSLAWVSIDNDDSRDLDQLSAAEDLGDGSVRLLVAVADVDAAVPRGTAIDERARKNSTSVYTPAQVFPMLPERLSTDLTSLNADEDRLALVVSLTVGRDGTVADAAVSRALVRNKAQLAYDSVAAWLDREAAPPAAAASEEIEAQIRLQDGVAGAMKERREERGALALAGTESTVVFDGDVLADLRPDEENRAKEMIQDFMIAANTATARFLEARGFPSLRRILRAPARWERIVALARDLGEALPEAPSARALQAFLLERRAADPVRFPDLSLSVVKLLGSGEYGVEVPGRPTEGHFGLAVKDYTHSTAPNRRYPDLVTQRLVKAALADAPCPYSVEDLEALARHCTEQEDDAAKVERQVHKSAAAMLLASRKGERFDGIVTGASPKGTWVRVFRPPVEGRVVRGEAGLDVGERVRVELLDTDVERGFVDFARA